MQLNENQEALKFCNIACASELCTKEKKKVVLNLRGTIHSILGQYIDAVKDFKASYDIIADFGMGIVNSFFPQFLFMYLAFLKLCSLCFLSYNGQFEQKPFVCEISNFALQILQCPQD